MSLISNLEYMKIPTNTVAAAVDGVNNLSDANVKYFLNMLTFTAPSEEEARPMARLIARAIVSGAPDINTVRGFIGRRAPTDAEAYYRMPAPSAESTEYKPARSLSATVTTAPVEVSADAAVKAMAATLPKVTTGRRGRKAGITAFDRAVPLMEATMDREERIAAMESHGISRSSALVYIWRFNKGERAAVHEEA